MLKYILKRLGLAVLILLGVSLIIYILVSCMPYDYVQQKLASVSTVEDYEGMAEALYKSLGLYGEKTFVNILKGYFTWLGNLFTFNFGNSFIDGQAVTTKIANHMGLSFAIAFIAIIFEYLIAIPLGITAATHQYAVRDYVVTVLVMVGISLPSFFFGRMLQSLFAAKLGWFPQAGELNAKLVNPTFFELIGDYLHHLFLPILAMVVLGIGGTMRYVRTNMLEVLNADYIRTARAKGLKESKVIYKHAFRNTLIPLVTMMAGILPTLFSGAMLTETVFNLSGIGKIAYDAMIQVDIPFIMGYNVFLAVLSVIGVLLSDIMYMVVDPRVKLA